MDSPVLTRLKEAGVQPSAQRLAVAEYVLATQEHPSADQVLRAVQARFPMVSRATVYNTLKLLVERGLLRQLVLAEGNVVFDPLLAPHHHFIDDETGLIEDIPHHAVAVGDVSQLEGYEVREAMLVLRGTKKRAARPPAGRGRAKEVK